MDIPVKICGIRDEAALDAALEAGASYIGFIHYPASPRHVSFGEAARLRARVPEGVKSVSVTVNADDEVLEEILREVRPDMLQLHGHETPDRIRRLRASAPYPVGIVKALPVRKAEDILAASAYAGVADAVLFDAPAPAESALPGGNGVAFAWEMLDTPALAQALGATPWFLSGGLKPDNIEAAIRASGARRIDVSSGVERAPGVKDLARIRAFMEAVRRAKEGMR